MKPSNGLVLAGFVLLVGLVELFNDGESGMAMLFLGVGLVGIALVARAPLKKASWPLVALLWGLSLWPLASLGALWALALELQKTSGGWPQVMIDDPKNWYGNATPRYDALYELVDYCGGLGLLGFLLFLTLYFACRERFSPLVRRLSWALMGAAVVVHLYDPGHLYAWWMD